MENLKKNKGITLVALVVTIVVLLILAGITISVLSDENGIIGQAKVAKQNTEDAIKAEEEFMNNLLNEMNNAINGINNTNSEGNEPAATSNITFTFHSKTVILEEGTTWATFISEMKSGESEYSPEYFDESPGNGIKYIVNNYNNETTGQIHISGYYISKDGVMVNYDNQILDGGVYDVYTSLI